MFQSSGGLRGRVKIHKSSKAASPQRSGSLGPGFKSVDQRLDERVALSTFYGRAVELVRQFGAWFDGVLRRAHSALAEIFGGVRDKRSARGNMFGANFGLGLEPLEVRAMMSVSSPNPFTPGDIVAVQVGANGATTALNDLGTTTYLDEYTPAGILVQQIPLPGTATTSGGIVSNALLLGNGTSEGELNLSTDGADLLLTGFSQTVTSGNKIESSTATADPRTIGEISVAGVVNTGTVLNNSQSAGDARSVVGSNATGSGLADRTQRPA